jgi:YbbR domain-containing protein
VDVEIVGLETATYNVKNISVINGPENAEVTVETESLDVVIRGAAEKLEGLNAENIRVVADLTDYKDSSGPFMAQAKVYCDGVSDVGAIGKYTISVNIDRTEKKDRGIYDAGSNRDTFAAKPDGGGVG